jgi:CPA2 family monovalent cation:H+ antiporter-2
VVARLSDPEFFEIFSELNVTDLVYPELEAGLEMTRQVLLALRIPVTEIQRHTEALRQEFFTSRLSQSKPYQTLAQFRSAEQQFDLQWVKVGEDCRLVGQSIGESEIRKKTGVSVVGVLRDDHLEPNPGPEFRFQEKDLVAIIGSAETRSSFQTRFFPAERLNDQPADILISIPRAI